MPDNQGKAVVRITFELHPENAAGLKRFAEKVSHADAMAVLYPHVERDIRDNQAYQIIEAFGVLEKALAEANVASWPWIETGKSA
jgi:hypothetical protein